MTLREKERLPYPVAKPGANFLGELRWLGGVGHIDITTPPPTPRAPHPGPRPALRRGAPAGGGGGRHTATTTPPPDVTQPAHSLAYWRGDECHRLERTPN